jgi:hypothetical protein
MNSSGSLASPSAGQRRRDSPDYAPSKSPVQSLVVTLYLPPILLQLFTYWAHRKSDDGDDKSEEESLDDSCEDDFEGSLTEEIYDNSNKKVIYDSGGELEVEALDPDSDFESDGVLYQSIEHDDDRNSQNGSVGQSIGEDYEQVDSDEAGGAFATKPASPNPWARSSTAKLLASYLNANPSFLYNYLQRNNHLVEQFLTHHPVVVEQFLRRNYQQALSLLADDPRWFIEDYLNKHTYLVEGYLADHPDSVEGVINANPVYFDKYLVRHPEFAITYLHYNRLPNGCGFSPDMFGVTTLVDTPQPRARTPFPPSAALPPPGSFPRTVPPLPPQPAGLGRRKSTTRKPQATRKPPTKPTGRPQQLLPNASPVEGGRKTQHQPPKSNVAPTTSRVPSLTEEPITPESGPKKTTDSSHGKTTTTTTVAVSSNVSSGGSSNTSSSAQTYEVLLTSTYGQLAGAFMSYPAPRDLLAASRKQNAGTKSSWRLFEEDRAIKHMLDIRDEAQVSGEARFQQVSDRLKAEGIGRGFFAVKNYWNRTGRARSGFDERKNKTAPLATSKQGKTFRQAKKAKGQSKEGGKRAKAESDESEESHYGFDGFSVYSEEETTPPPPLPLLPAPPPVQAQTSSQKRPADHDDETLARVMERGTRPKKPRIV